MHIFAEMIYELIANLHHIMNENNSLQEPHTATRVVLCFEEYQQSIKGKDKFQTNKRIFAIFSSKIQRIHDGEIIIISPNACIL